MSDDHTIVIVKLDIPEVPVEDDNVTRIEDELDSTTYGAETEGTRHQDLLLTFNDIGQTDHVMKLDP